MKDKIIIHIDMDAFFASVEQLDNPEYRGKPVIVGADPREGDGRGVVSTCSYEAREYGIHSAMPISRAYSLCPDGIFVKPRGKRYSEISKKIMEKLYDFTPQIEKISIDEAFMDMTGCFHFYRSLKEMGKKIKKSIKKEFDLTASVGIATNKSIAKIASDLEKPDGITICYPGNEKTFLKNLKIDKLWGVGEKTSAKLEKMGLYKIGDIAEIPLEFFKKRMGKSGVHIWKLANGIDSRDVEMDNSVKSISNEITFHEDTNDREKIKNTIFTLSEKIGSRARKKNLKGRTIFLKLRLKDFSTFTRRKTIDKHISNTVGIKKIAFQLFENFKYRDSYFRLIGVGLANLKKEVKVKQLNLFSNKEEKKGKILDKTIDEIKEKFGNKIQRGTFLYKKNREEEED